MPVRVDPVTADSGFWTRYHKLRRVRQQELDPDMPLEPDAETEARMKKPDPFDEHVYFEISRAGSMVGWLVGETVTPANPEYETNKHLFWAGGYVVPEARREGVGTQLLSAVVEVMEAHGCTVFGTDAHHEDGHAFLRWLGAQPRLTDVESRLDLTKVDWAMVEQWVEEGRRRSPDTRLEVYDGGLPEAMWADYSAQQTVMLNSMPLEGLDLGEIIVTPERMREHYDRSKLSGEVPHEMFTREPDGVISAMTDMSWAPHRSTHLHQEFTGVLASARGRGLGKWVKAAMLLHLREVHPEARWVLTENAHSNEAMLDINRRLGFRPYREVVTYQVSLDQIKGRIASS